MREIGRTLLFASTVMLSVSLVMGDDATQTKAGNNAKAPAAATGSNNSTNSPARENNADSKGEATPHLGVFVSPIHPAIHNHFGSMLARNQGLIVEDVEEGSAAAKAGIKQHDILTMYDDQKLFATEQLANLIHSDKVGHEVTFVLLRDGQQKKIQVKLEEDGSAHQHYQSAYHNGGQGSRHHRHGAQTAHNAAHDARDSGWESFDSMTLKKLKDNKFQAEVKYLDQDGKTRKHTFEGTREELQKAIESEKDIKPNERAHLLQSLGFENSDASWQFAPPFWFDPRGAWFEDPYETGL